MLLTLPCSKICSTYRPDQKSHSIAIISDDHIVNLVTYTLTEFDRVADVL